MSSADPQSPARGQASNAGTVQQRSGFEAVAAISTLFGLLLLLFATGGVLNAAFDLDLVVSISGSDVALPDDWDVVVPLYVLAGSCFGLAQVAEHFFGILSFVKRRRWAVAALVSASFALGLAGYHFWLRYSLSGGKVAWAVVHQRPDVLEQALAERPSPEQLVTAGLKAAHLNRGEMLRKLIAAGMPLNPTGNEACLLSASVVNADLELLVMELEAGAEPLRCYEKSQMLSRLLLRDDLDRSRHAVLLEITQLMVARGVDPHDRSYQHPFEMTWRNKSALEIARDKKLLGIAQFLESLPSS